MASTLFTLFGGNFRAGKNALPAPANATGIPQEFSTQLSRLKAQLGGRDPMSVYNGLNLTSAQRQQVKAVADKIYGMMPH